MACNLLTGLDVSKNGASLNAEEKIQKVVDSLRLAALNVNVLVKEPPHADRDFCSEKKGFDMPSTLTLFGKSEVDLAADIFSAIRYELRARSKPEELTRY